MFFRINVRGGCPTGTGSELFEVLVHPSELGIGTFFRVLAHSDLMSYSEVQYLHFFSLIILRYDNGMRHFI